MGTEHTVLTNSATEKLANRSDTWEDKIIFFSFTQDDTQYVFDISIL